MGITARLRDLRMGIEEKRLCVCRHFFGCASRGLVKSHQIHLQLRGEIHNSGIKAFVGVVIIVFSSYVLNKWNHQPPPPNPWGIRLPPDVVSPQIDALRFNLQSLPAPWFAYASLGIGILVCCISFIGHIGTEVMSGCCLCFYTILSTIFVLLEMCLVAFITLDHHWQKDIPSDPTGEMDSLLTFIQENIDVFEWIGITILTIQIISLLLAVTLKSLVSSQKVDDEIEVDYGYSINKREPLLTSYSSQASASPRGDSDIWSSRMREKYGLSSSDLKHTLLNQHTSVDVKQ